jgi:hypothetical protein
MTPPFFQATIAESSQSNFHRHSITLCKTDAHQGISPRRLLQQRCVHSIADRRGEREAAVKTIAQGMPGVPVNL